MLTTRTRHTLTALAAMFAVAVPLAAAGPAAAEDNAPTTQPKSCPVEDEHGNVTYVKPGTRVGMFVCGEDGEWHFGWLITGHIAPPDAGTDVPDRPPAIVEVTDAQMATVIEDTGPAPATEPAAPAANVAIAANAQTTAPESTPAAGAKYKVTRKARGKARRAAKRRGRRAHRFVRSTR